jgi:sialate O-acetylesterase
MKSNALFRSALLFLLANASLLADPALAPARPFAHHMVLPMERPTPVWGMARPGATVEIRFADDSVTGKADALGQWRITLPAQDASAESRELLMISGDERVVLRDVLVGEVWLCSGQSNMDFPLAKAVGGKQEAATAGDFPTIRLMNLTGIHTYPQKYNESELGRLTPDAFFQGTWQIPSEKSALEFSAVAWWAGKFIQQAKQVPVGLIDNSVGGSGAEAWLPREVLSARGHDELLGESWLESERVSAWARGRARLNLGSGQGNHPFRPGFLFDSGVRWWRNFPLNGVLWYQGETNAEMDDDVWNERLISDLLIGWRRILGQAQLPFFMVQLPRIGGNDPLRRHWPQFRAVQARAAARLPHVSLIKTIDLGWDSPDVHPPDKRPIGERLGKAAAN